MKTPLDADLELPTLSEVMAMEEEWSLELPEAEVVRRLKVLAEMGIKHPSVTLQVWTGVKK